MTQPIALITGGNRGIGKAIAEALICQGVTTIVTYRSGAAPVGFLAVQMDVTSTESVDAGFAEIEEKYGTPEIIIANAGMTKDSLVLRMSVADFSEVVMDKDQLKQAFINIIFNAVQAMPAGGKLAVSTLKHSDEFIKATFSDTGTGIEKDNLERIFNPFFTTKDDGTGLGLPIVQRIIEEHGGRINVFSKPGEGSVFEVLLPVWKENVKL